MRVTLVLAIGFAVAAAAFAIWWLTSLNGLPDIGEPFDVAEFRAFSIPDEQNAFTSLRREQEKCVPFNEWGPGAQPSDLKFSWSIAIPKLREWARLNQEALELFQKAAEQPDAANPAEEPVADLEGGGLFWLAVLDASRRQELGDTAGAWDRYRAVLGMITHFRRRGSSRQRGRARGESRTLQRRLVDWAADSRTTIAQLHTALDEILKNEPKAEWNLFAIKSEYLEILRAMDRPIEPDKQQGIEGEWTFRLGDMALSPGIVAQLEWARRFVLREPERSRRVLRLLCANYLAHAATRGLPSPKPAVWVLFSYVRSTNPITKRKVGMPIYPVGPEAEAGPPHYRRRRWPVGWSQPSTPGCGCCKGILNGSHGIVLSIRGLLLTARRTANSSSCWPRRSIAVSAAPCRLPTKPWSDRISRAYPTMAWASLSMRIRLSSSSDPGT